MVSARDALGPELEDFIFQLLRHQRVGLAGELRPRADVGARAEVRSGTLQDGDARLAGHDRLRPRGELADQVFVERVPDIGPVEGHQQDAGVGFAEGQVDEVVVHERSGSDQAVEDAAHPGIVHQHAQRGAVGVGLGERGAGGDRGRTSRGRLLEVALGNLGRGERFEHQVAARDESGDFAGGEASVAKAIETYFIGYGWLAKFVTVAILAGFSSVILVMLLGQSRVFYSMSRDGLVPKIFSETHPKYRTPWKSNLLFFVFTSLFAGFLPDSIVGEMTSIGTLFAFALVCLGVLALRYLEPERPRPFRVPFVWPVALTGAAAGNATEITTNTGSSLTGIYTMSASATNGATRYVIAKREMIGAKWDAGASRLPPRIRRPDARACWDPPGWCRTARGDPGRPSGCIRSWDHRRPPRPASIQTCNPMRAGLQPGHFQHGPSSLPYRYASQDGSTICR